MYIYKDELQKIEDYLYRWLKDNKYKSLTVMFSTLVLLNSTRIPYINLYLTQEVSYLVTILFIIGVFNIQVKKIFKTGLVLFLLAFVFYIFDRNEVADRIGNIIYSLFLFGVIKSLLLINKRSKI